MPKLGPVFLIVSTAIILLSFGALCYLMTTVNPKPTKNPDARRYNPMDTPYANEILLKSDNLDYGLEKIEEDESVTVNAMEYPHTLSMYRFFSSGDSLQSVVPPVWPDFNSTQIVRNFTKHENKSAIMKSIPLPIKGHRRSIKEEVMNQITIPNSLILNIIDNHGIPKIVIKVGGEKVNKRKRSSNNKIRTISLKDENNSTLVLIEVNDSVVLNIADDSINFDDTKDIESARLNKELDINNTSNMAESFKNKFNNINETKSGIFESNHTNPFVSSQDLTNMTDFHFNINYSDFIKNMTVYNSSTEGVYPENVNSVTDVSNTMYLETNYTKTKTPDRLVDLFIREDALKDVLVQENDRSPNTENINSTRSIFKLRKT